MEIIPGFAPGIVTNNADPDGTGRVKVRIPGLIEPETPYWIMPFSWPGAGRGDARGSQYPPPPVGAQVAVIFEFGQWMDPHSNAGYLTGYYGQTEEGAQAGPLAISEATSAEEALKRTVLWEGETLRSYIIEDSTEKRLVLESKTTGSKIEINATDGEEGNSETVYIEGRTLVSIYSKGLVDIQADGGVQIQGRRVDDITERGI